MTERVNPNPQNFNGGIDNHFLLNLMPAGIIVPFAGDQYSVPEGWLLCNGTTADRTAFARLFAVIGTSWGEGNGTTTFNIPDLRGTFLRGVNNGAGRDPNAGSRFEIATGGAIGDNVGSLQEDTFQGHGHTVGDNYRDGYYSNELGNGSFPGWNYTGSNGALGPLRTKTTASAGHGAPRTATETRPVNAYVNFIIRY